MPKSASKTLYPKIEVQLCVGKEALTSDKAKKLLGWEETEAAPLLKDANGKGIACVNNTSNRPFYPGLCRLYKQEHLRKRWRLNGETIIIGKTGQVLEGQHSLVALVLAVQEYEADPELHVQFWDAEPIMEKLVVFGIAEDDETVNTINSGKSRSLTDVLYRSEFFANSTIKNRRKLAKIADYAVRFLWVRTGVPTTLRRTHFESVDFLIRHRKLVECVQHIFDEEKGNKNLISQYISPGCASGLLYLMSACKSDVKKYNLVDPPTEETLDFESWAKACDFWTELALGSKEFGQLKKVMTDLRNRDGSISLAEQCALIVKAWNCWLIGQPITSKSIRLKYETDDDDFQTLAECPSVGGIDLGDPTADEEEDPTPEEIRERKTAEDNKRKAKKKKSKTKTTPFNFGDSVWVKDDDGSWQGKIKGSYSGSAGLVAEIEDAAGKVYHLAMDTLQAEEPA